MSTFDDKLLIGYGTEKQVSNTVKAIELTNSWEDFNKLIKNSGNAWNYINPYAIKDIVEEYYKNKKKVQDNKDNKDRVEENYNNEDTVEDTVEDNKKNNFFSWSSNNNTPLPNGAPRLYGYTYVRTEIRNGKFNIPQDGYEQETWDIYKNPLGFEVSIKRKPKKGGKRKTHRKQKTNKYKKRKNKSRKIKKKYL
jgi:hypothetical protein